jgi:hypothetical protein
MEAYLVLYSGVTSRYVIHAKQLSNPSFAKATDVYLDRVVDGTSRVLHIFSR